MKAKRVVVCALEAPSRRRNLVKAKKPKGTRRYTLTIDQGQDIREKVLTYFQDGSSSSGSSKGHKRMGVILQATGSIFNPKMDADKSSYEIKNIEGRFIMSKNGQVQQHELWFISCVGSSGLLIRDEVNGRLVAAEPVQVVVGTFPLQSK